MGREPTGYRGQEVEFKAHSKRQRRGRGPSPGQSHTPPPPLSRFTHPGAPGPAPITRTSSLGPSSSAQLPGGPGAGETKGQRASSGAAERPPAGNLWGLHQKLAPFCILKSRAGKVEGASSGLLCFLATQLHVPFIPGHREPSPPPCEGLPLMCHFSSSRTLGPREGCGAHPFSGC